MSCLIEWLETRVFLSSTPAAPSDLVVFQRGSGVVLAFTDNSADETRFIVERGGYQAEQFFKVGEVSGSDPGVAGGRIFFYDFTGFDVNLTYRVRAVNAGGVSEPSNSSFIVVHQVLPGPKGFDAVFYDEPAFSGPPVRSDYAWLSSLDIGSRAPNPRVEPNSLSGVFEAFIRPDLNEAYTFRTASADGIALTVIDPTNGKVLLDFDNLAAERAFPENHNGYDGGAYQDIAGTVDLRSDRAYLIRLRYSKDTGDMAYRVGWSSFSTPLEPLPEDLMFPLAPGGPKVRGVALSGSRWAVGPLGAAQVVGADQISPRIGADQIKVLFDRDVQVSPDALEVSGLLQGAFIVTNVTFDSRSSSATFTLDRPVGRDRLSVTLHAAGIHSTDTYEILDGEPRPSTAFDHSPTSGDGAPGGDYHSKFAVLPGDVNQDGIVNAVDLVTARKAIGQKIDRPGYLFSADVDGSGVVNAIDAVFVRNQIGLTVPPVVALFADKERIRDDAATLPTA